MAPEAGHLRRVFGALAALVLVLALASPADAQRERRYGPQPEFNPFGFFGPLFRREPREPRDYRQRSAPRERATADQTKPPPPQKRETEPSKRVVVMGASLSDWLAYGLEEIYADQPEIGILRKNHLLTGLVRFDSKDETTWPQVAREFLKEHNPDVIVVLLGLEDRHAIRERAPAREPQQQGEAREGGAAQAPAPERRRPQSFEFRTDQWADLYAERIDEMIAALKSEGVPVIWVGLPSIRGTRSTSDMIYLNDLFRARAERANISYVDVWDGFVDESGRFTTSGPDVEGQVRRLRTSEGVYFTKAGARKLAHYVEREIKHVMGTRLAPIALPTDEQTQPTVQRPGQPAARPEAGPVLSLTKGADADELLGGGTRSGSADPLAVRVLVKGASVPPPAGRADNFFLTPEAAEAAKAAAAAEAAAAAASAAAAPAAAASTAAPARAQQITTEELKPAEEDDAKKPVASVDPAPAAPARRSKGAVRPSENRVQQQDRPPAQIPRPTVRRDDRAVERRARPPFDPLGLFR